ncbi:preprotein translocase subunit SecY [Thermoproteus tenax]|uniref:Sec translocase alpha subunit, Sec61alpha n=1 Tax=Thermoproteus tenax (strain ATCC 35583 / DSM 2078 / JCM 9277 / NBRC 100435 / Kra 1) TaxID=768679 RepID=G4RKF3_THETK|nr:preprotein translocase subunit SecY [Thermoproteus tenax]CCC82048.1 Sec translocase alpha subunit, Sec61alpha [Thermoproteus tenax Kra 1]
MESLDPILERLITIKRPSRPLPLSTRLMWTALAALVYIVMTITPLWGIPRVQPSGPLYNIFYNPLVSTIFGTTYGTWAQLGIGPIVVAGIVLEILQFSGLLPFDLEDKKDRLRFSAFQKLLALIMAAGETAASIAMGAFGHLTPLQALAVFIQLIAATQIVILLDDMIAKGWGFGGSAINLVILLSVTRTFFVDLFSWNLPSVPGVNAADYPAMQLPLGFLPALAVAIYNTIHGAAPSIADLVFRQLPPPYGTSLPDIVSFAATLALAYVIVYIEQMHVNIPAAYTQYWGIRINIPLRFMYVSVIPIIFTAYSLILAEQIVAGFATLTGGISPALALLLTAMMPARILSPDYIVLHILLYAALATVFAWLWGQIGGIGPDEYAKNLVESGLHVPGFRQSEKIVARVLRRPINTLILLSGMIAGTLAALGDIFGVWGSGIGLILLVEIGLGYYMQILQEGLMEVYPGLRRVIGQ